MKMKYTSPQLLLIRWTFAELLANGGLGDASLSFGDDWRDIGEDDEW